jgi:signal transduction histidine kinase
MTGAGRRRGLRPASVRVRATLAAVVVVAVTTAVGAALLLWVLRGLLTDELADATRNRAAEIAATLRPADVLPVGDLEDDAIQLVRGDGTVVAASANVLGRPPMVWPSPGDDPVEIVGPVGGEPLVVVAHEVDGQLLLVARTIDIRNDTLDFATRLLALGLPALLAVVAVLTWVLVGRALQPVEAIRREVDEISATALDRRIPEPPTRDEIARLAGTMNRMLDRLERAHLRQSRFAADASHELRSPVAAIRQHAEVALAHPERTGVTALARVVLAEDLRVQHLVEDLLLLSRADEHSLRLARGPVDLDDIVFAEAGRLRAAHALRVDTTGVSAARFLGNVGALRRVLRNLGENAARYARSRIAFTLADSESGVVLAVDDDGPGIPVVERERVLQRFVRLDDARDRDSGGSGLGLAIVNELVTAHGGNLRIEDAPGGGARLLLTFPSGGPNPPS